MYDIRADDLSGQDMRDLLALHLVGMEADTPAGHVFALDLSGLRAPEISVWSARTGDAVVGVVALKHLGDGTGEVKSMRTHPRHLRRGVGAALLDHVAAEAERRSYRRLSLETGRGPSFEPALALYRRRGFVDGEAFADYRASRFNQFLHLPLRTAWSSQ